MRNRALTALTLCFSLCLQAQPSKSMFVFKNNFRLNLHQFLRGEVYRNNRKLPPGLDPDSLNEAERAAWTAALADYTDLAQRDILFDGTLRRIHITLATVGDVQRLPKDIVGASATAALNQAAPIYRARVWPERQRANAEWLASVKELLERHESAMIAALAASYHITWPSDPILVIAVGEVGPNSAITHEGPPGFAALTQAGAASPRNTGDAPLELVFHEAAHATPVESRIRAMIADECARQKLDVPDNLWHAMIMFASGAITQRELTKTGSPAYVPYAYRYHQLTPVEQAAFERDWQPYLDGKATLDEALHDLIRDAR